MNYKVVAEKVIEIGNNAGIRVLLNISPEMDVGNYEAAIIESLKSKMLPFIGSIQNYGVKGILIDTVCSGSKYPLHKTGYLSVKFVDIVNSEINKQVREELKDILQKMRWTSLFFTSPKIRLTTLKPESTQVSCSVSFANIFDD